MLSLPPCVRIFVSTEPTDMRNSFDGLAARAALVAAEGPMSGHLFVFFNRSRSHVKILWWDRTGYLVLAKRLESGRFRFLDRVQPSSTKLELGLAPVSWTPGKERKMLQKGPRWARSEGDTVPSSSWRQ